MNVNDVLCKVDELMNECNYEDTKSLILGALRDAVVSEDSGATLSLTNEYLGFLRKTSAFDEVDIIVDRLLKLIDNLSLKGSIPAATTYINIANTYRFEGNKDLALHYFNEALLIMSDAGKIYDTAYIESCLANLYFEMSDYIASRKHALSAIENFEKSAPNDLSLASSLYIMGLLYNNEGDSKNAREVLNHALSIIGNDKNEFYYRVMDELKRTPDDFVSGMSLAKEYYEECFAPLLKESLPDYLDKIAVGLVGRGSECFGFDDASSMDHDWGPGLCIWVSKETYAEIGKKLESIYVNLPTEFNGLSFAAKVSKHKRKGVFIIEDFFKELLGFWPIGDNYPLIPDFAMATAVNGEIFTDKEGAFTKIYNELKAGYPEGYLYKKLAESAAKFSQCAQYNAPRMLKRRDEVSASIMLSDGIKEAMKLAHHIERKYPPHDKWLYKSTSQLENGRELTALIREAMNTGNVDALGEYLAMRMYLIGYISDSDDYLDHHTDELLFKSEYADLSSEALIDKIVDIEYIAFDRVKNEGGRADCQDDWDTFSIMRKSQYLNWTHEMLLQYYYDFHREYHLGHNLITEKYGRMMESTAPERYEEIKGNFPEISSEKKAIIETIVSIQVGWMDDFCDEFPKLAGRSRSVHTYEDNYFNTSYETYLRGEISTYSDKMLELYGRFISSLVASHQNLAYLTMGTSTKLYGYNSLKEAEEKA